MNEARIEEIRGHLVRHPQALPRLRAQLGEVLPRQARKRARIRGPGLGEGAVPEAHLARAIDGRMGGEDLLGEGGARARHADDEYRPLRVARAGALGAHEGGIAPCHDPLDELAEAAAVVA